MEDVSVWAMILEHFVLTNYLENTRLGEVSFSYTNTELDGAGNITFSNTSTIKKFLCLK